VKFLATKLGKEKNFSLSLFFVVAGLLDPECTQIRIRDKHPGSATLIEKAVENAGKRCQS
jgi:hypothetical protein